MNGEGKLRTSPNESRIPSYDWHDFDGQVTAGLPFFSNQILQHRDVQCLIGHDALQLPVLFFELLQPFRFAYFQSAVLTAPSVKRRCADPMLPA
jgi:hypothetical protein